MLKYGADGKLLATTGGYGWEQGTFDRPADLIAPNGLDVYVADFGNNRVQRFDRNLNFVSSYSTLKDEEQPLKFGYPQSLALSRFGSLFIVDGENKRILKLTPGGTVERAFANIGSGAGKLSSPGKIKVSADDRVYVVDGNTVVVFDIFGNYIRRFGLGVFTHVRSLAVDRQTVYIVDSCRVYTFTKENSIQQKFDLAHSLHPMEPCDLVDIAVSGQTFYFLTPHTIIRQLLKPEDAR
ncbi:MAG: NHL repeat-containing protein [Ignavibacteriae bacterium]|nr:NHL repeat-containing protein [Ignavibacteriota bacterium]